MSNSPSCLSFLLCKNSKKHSNKKSSESKISSLQEFISQKTNSSTQTPSSENSRFKRNLTFTQVAAAALGGNASHKSTIAIKKTDGFFQKFESQDKLETAESELSVSSITNKLSYEVYSNSSLSNKTFSEIFKSKDQEICWNNKFSSASPSKFLANPFVANTNSSRPRIIAITPITCLRKRLLPNILKNNQRKNENMISNIKLTEKWMDDFEGISSNSLVNL